MPQTMLNRYTYPEFDSNPYWEVITGLYGEIDVGLYQTKNREHAFLCGGGALSWNSAGSTFT